MAHTTRQSNLFASEDWTKVYETFREIDFQAYDFQTIRKTMIDYLRTYYPEDFNDYIESSEYIALIDLIAYIAQSLSFRADLNARENFLETAERRDSILRIAKMLNYQPKRAQIARGLLKIQAVQTTENVIDSNGNNLQNTQIFWGDNTNPDFLEQFTTVLNASFDKTQRFGTPALRTTVVGVPTDEYHISIVPNTVGVYPFESDVGGNTFGFEIVNGTYSGTNFLYEVSPQPGNTLNCIYKNDSQGFASVNNGFFFYFKQGQLQTVDFNISESLPNRVVEIDTNNIDNNDVWLYSVDENGLESEQWTKVPAINGTNVIYNSLNNSKNQFAVNSRSADQVGLSFGDGVFSNIPTGNFRAYFRVGNGFTYKITPQDITNVTLDIPYISHSSQVETLTVVLSLEYTVANASARENLNDIKLKAQQQYYTQQRMITGEDYQILPYTSFNNIIKSKAVNRTASGVSRYLDVRDTTGKYSSTNIVAEDGIFYREDVLKNFVFNFTTAGDISNTISKNLEPIIQNKETYHYYLENYPFIVVTGLDVDWNRSTQASGSCTGFFKNATSDAPQPIGNFTSSNLKYVKQGSLVKFTAPAGKVFDLNNNLITGTSGTANTKDYIWSGISSVIDDGINQGTGNLSTGAGPVTLSENIPSDAVLDSVIAPWNTVLSSTLRQTIVDNVLTYKTFGLRYDYATSEWKIITGANLDQSNTFSLDYAGNEQNLNRDASWIFKFTNDGSTYTVNYRSLAYLFESYLETRFYFDKDLKIFDPRTGKTIRDKISILKVNAQPDNSSALNNNYIMNVDDKVIESDGYVLSEKVKVTFPDQDDDGVVDDPEVFDKVVAPDVNSTSKIVFYETYLDASGFERFEAVPSTSVDTSYTSLADIEAAKESFSSGQLFYITGTQKFYVLSINASNEKTVTESTDYTTKTGRSDLLFQYTHNSPNNRRIDPSPTNIIDLFLLTTVFDNDYRNYVQDITGTVQKPTKPTTTELRDAYGELDNYKSISDTIVFNSVTYRPLFGTKAEEELQASFKVVKNKSTLISDNEIKAKVISAVNEYFAIENWDFGDTFYFSELSAYLHNVLTPDVLSIIIVPRSTTASFGSLYQIQSQSDEIFISAATVNDVDVIDVITAAQLRASGTVINTTSSNLITESVGETGTSTVASTTNTLTVNNSVGITSNGGYSY
jgi:hypothetical protein